VLGAIAALALFVTIVALSARQATTPATATRLLAAGIASLTDIDATLEQDEDELREVAAASDGDEVFVPGYPVAVPLTRQEALTLPRDELRRTILVRAANFVYLDGLDAFDQTGDASVDLLSSEGQLKLVVDQISAGTHRRAGRVALVAVVVAGLAAAGAVAVARGYTSLRTLGWAAMLAAIAVLALTLLASLAVAQLGGDDPFMRDLRVVIQTGIDIPQRNALVVGALAATLLVLGYAGPLAERRVAGWAARSATDDTVV